MGRGDYRWFWSEFYELALHRWKRGWGVLIRLRQLRQHALQVALKTLTERLIFVEKVDGTTLRRDGLFQMIARRE